MDWKNLSKKQWIVLIVSALAFVFGVLFCVLSQTMLNTVKVILSIAILGYGAFYLMSYCILSFDSKDPTLLIHAIGGIGLGVLLIFVPSFFVSAVSVIVIILGLARLSFNIKAKKNNTDVQTSRTVVGVFEIVIALALLIICNLNVPALLVSIYLGSMLILEAVVSVVYVWIDIQTKKYEVLPKEETSQE